MELGKLDEAETTLNAALKLEPSTKHSFICALYNCWIIILTSSSNHAANDVLQRMARTLMGKKQALTQPKKATKQLDEAQMKEVHLHIKPFVYL